MTDRSQLDSDLKEFNERVQYVRDSIARPEDELELTMRLDSVLERLGEAISQELPSFRRQQVLSAAEDAMIQLSHEYPQVLKAVQELRSNQARKMLRDFICDLALVLETIPKDKTIPYNEFIKSANEALSQFDEGLISLEELHRRAHSIMVGTVKLGAQFLKNEGTSG